MTHLKTLISIILFLASTGILLSFANDGTSLTISGKSTIYDFVTETYEASASNGEITSCRWSQSDPVSNAYVDVTPRGNQCDVTFRSYGGVTLECNAYIKLGETTKTGSGSKIIRCFPPPINGDPSIDIEGPSEVTLNSTKTYNAIHSGTKDTPSFTWRYHGQTRSGESTEIHFVTNGTVHLECTMSYKDDNNEDQSLSDDMDINVLPPITLSAMRADYKNYTNAIISGINNVYIHFNIDDDDESASDNTRGTDCLQKEFANGGLDDDLCKIKLNLGANIDPEKITNGTLIFETSEGLRLWTSPYRTKFILEQNQTTGLSFGDDKEKTEILRILRDGLYVEGVLSGQHSLTIRLADKELILPYICCSVGGITDQPTGKQRKYYKEAESCNFKDLIGCEWCVKKLTPSSHLKTYNCIAYAVDPEKEVFRGTNVYSRPFEGAFWVYINEQYDQYLKGFDSWYESNWRSEPFAYVISITKYAFNNKLKTKFKNGFWDEEITPTATASPGDDGVFVFAGYSFAFKDLLSDILKEQPNLINLENRYTTMTILNRGSSYSDFVDNFFNLADFATTLNNNHQLQSCDTNDIGRVIVYYSNYHAARSLANAPGCSDFDDNIDPSWEISASKCGGAEELLIHRERQLTFPYGLINKAYK